MSRVEPRQNASRESVTSTIKADFLASIVVFLVALPLCMGIAIASGAPVAAGLITGIVGGLVVGTLAGSPLQVSGPAAGLTVIVYDVIQEFGLEMLGLVVLIAGILQILAGVFRLGQWFRAVSPAVIKGMLAGIGVLIFASQFHVMVDDKPQGSGLQNLMSIPSAIGKGLAMPEMNSREVRVERTEMLRAAGEIHRRQVDLFERISSRMPHPSPSHSKLELAKAAKVVQPEVPTTDDLADLAAVQEAIAKDLNALLNRLSDHADQRAANGKALAMMQSAQAAQLKNQAALQALSEDVDRVIETQIEAVHSLENLLVQHKNHHLAAMLGLLTIVLIVAWQAFSPKKLRVIPAPLLAIVATTLLASAFAIPVLYVEVPDNLWEGIHFPNLLVIDSALWIPIIQAGILIAVVASAETLLCATAVDQMHSGVRTRYDRELTAQGIGNSLCGFLGALPMTGVIVRSTANIQAGGRTRVSAILHGVWLLVFVIGLAFVLRSIPTAGLAAILVYTGYKLINPKSIRELARYGRGELVIFFATVVTIVATDLLTGVLVGVALAAVKLLYTFSHLETRLQRVDSSQKVVLHLIGAATFVRLPKLAAALELVPADGELHVDFEHLDYIDHACLDLLMNWARQHESTGGRLVIDWNQLHARFRANGKTVTKDQAVTSPRPNLPSRTLESTSLESADTR